MKFLKKDNNLSASGVKDSKINRFITSKAYFLKLVILIVAISFSSCSDDEIIEELPPSVSLTFITQTEEDQMGDFKDNAMAVFNEKVWSIGGENSYGGSGSHIAWNSDNGVNWYTVSVPFTDFRRKHTLTVFDNKLWLIGGENSLGDFIGSIWYTEDGISWINPFVIAPFGEVSAHNTVVFNGKMYVIAGSLSTGNTMVWSTSNGFDWIEETLNAFSGRGGHKTVVFNNAIYVIGGEDIAGTRLNEIWTSTNGSDWTLVITGSSVFTSRSSHTATVYNNKVWIIGGSDDTSLYNNDIWYSSNMIDWKKYADTVSFDRLKEHTALVYNDGLWVFGGDTSTGLTGEITSFKED